MRSSVFWGLAMNFLSVAKVLLAVTLVAVVADGLATSRKGSETTSNISSQSVMATESATTLPPLTMEIVTTGQPRRTEARKARIMSGIVNVKCPRPEDIHPCDCLELAKGTEESFSGDGDSSDGRGNSEHEETDYHTPNKDQEKVHPDLVETVAFCKNIRHPQVLSEAIKGFQGHRINFFVLDGCKLPPFPNSLFKNIRIHWLEILNATIQFHEPFFECSRDCL